MQQNLAPQQTGFRTGYSTQYNLTKICSKIRKGGFVVFFDYRSAFDITPRDKILQMIDERGILTSKEVQALVFLWNQARIKVEASVVVAGRGVPQGSIVSPLLFSIFTQLLIEHFDDTPVLKSNMMFYADDLAIYSENLPGILQAIGKVREWSAENNMELNNAKSAVMEFL